MTMKTDPDVFADKVATAKSLASQAEQAMLDDAMEDSIQCLQFLAETATSALETAVLIARDRGMTWERVGRWLGVSRQAAQERFGRL